MFSLPRDSWGIPTAFRAAAQCVRIDIPGEDQLVLHGRSQPRGPRRRNRPNPRLQRTEARPGRALQPRHQVLRRGQLRRLQAGRRRGGRRHHQRPIPGPRRGVPVGHRPPVAGVHPLRPAAHDRRRGARLRPITPQRPGRLRPRRAPAAGPDVAPRAGRHRQSRATDPGADGGAQGDRPDRHPAGRAGSSWPAWRGASTRGTSARTSSRTRATGRSRWSVRTSTSPTFGRSVPRSPAPSRSIPNSRRCARR